MIQKFRLSPEQIMNKILKMLPMTDTDNGIDILVSNCPSIEDLKTVQDSLLNEPEIEKYNRPEQLVI